MAKQKQLWDILVSPTTPPAIVGHDSRTMRFPLGVTRTDFVDGRTNPALQIADIIAGSCATLAGSRLTGAESEYITKLRALFTRTGFLGYTFLPSLDITPERLGTEGDGGEDPLEYMAQLISNAGVVPHD
jgi:hypothetical protein